MRLPVRGVVLRVLVVAALAAALGVGGVLDPTHAVVLGLVGIAAVGLRAAAADEFGAEWPSRSFESRAGARGAVSDLSWQVFGRDRRVRERVVERVRDLATARLALLGVDADDPSQAGEVERLLGPRVAAGLDAPRPPTARTLQTWLDAIDGLGHERTIP